MSGIEQLSDFNRFVAALPRAEQEAHLDVLFDRWREQALAEEDFRAIKESLQDFRSGERGKPHHEVMAELRAHLDDEQDG